MMVANPAPPSPTLFLRAARDAAARGELELARRCFEQVMASPLADEARLDYAQLLLAAGQLGRGLEVLAPRVEHPRSDVAALILAANLLLLVPDDAAAEGYLLRALELEPTHPVANTNLATVLTRRGDTEGAIEAHRRGLQRGPDSHALMGLVRLGALRDPQVLRDAIAARPWSPRARARLCFALAEVLRRSGDHAAALETAREANARMGAHWSPRSIAAEIERARRSPTTPRPSRSAEGPRPVFIVGMPRTGSTLVEQLLACSPEVAATGETMALPRALAELALATRDPGALARAYLARLPAAAATATVVTDKTLGNFSRLDVIAHELPGARVVHVLRDPVDSALSCYFHMFSEGSLPFAYDLDHLALYLRGQRCLTALWRERTGLPVLELRYEDLVDDLEGSARRLFAFCGLPWTAACMGFHRREAVVTTASREQVRRPLYRHATQHWRPYERLLPGYRASLLEPWDDTLTAA